jgi:hypothetical protein
VRVAHGHSNCRMSEQLLDCHNIHASRDQPRRKSVTQRVPGNTFDFGILASCCKTSLLIDEAPAGFVVIKDKVILSAHFPGPEHFHTARIVKTSYVLCLNRKQASTAEDIRVQEFIAEFAVRVVLLAQLDEVV